MTGCFRMQKWQLSTPGPHCRSDSPGGACLPSLRCGRVAFASYAFASLGRTRPRPLKRLWLSATALSTPSPHCRSDSPGGACRPSLCCGRVAFASYAFAALRPDPATASEEAIASLQISRGSLEELLC